MGTFTTRRVGNPTPQAPPRSLQQSAPQLAPASTATASAGDGTKAPLSPAPLSASDPKLHPQSIAASNAGMLHILVPDPAQSGGSIAAISVTAQLQGLCTAHVSGAP